MGKIQIKCSSCEQKFAVSESYMNRVVECGACDHRFKVDDSTVVRQKKKYYPGEKSQVNAESFAKTDSDSIPAQPVENNELGFQPAPQYQQNVDPSFAQPASTRRTFIILTGVSIIILLILVFVFGSRPDGILQDMDLPPRIILASFIAVLGSGLIIAGSRHKIKGVLLALLLGGPLVALSFLLPVLSTPESAEGSEEDTSDAPVVSVDEAEAERLRKIEAYKVSIGYRKVKSARANASDPSHVKALIIRDIGSHTDTICNYFQEELSLAFSPPTYTSGLMLENRRVTLIILESDITTADLLEMTKKFGIPAEMDEMRTELDVVEVLVREEMLTNASSVILSDESHKQFFDANYNELYHISRDRRISAIQRLDKVTTSLGRQADIADRLAKMINVKDQEISDEAIRTLKKWTSSEYKLDYKVKAYADALADKGNLAFPVMEYLVEKNIPEISDILAKQWLNSNGHLIWDTLIQKAGSEGETAIIKALPSADSSHLKAASSVLRKIGTEKSIPALTTALERAEKEDANYLKATIDEIKSRR